MGKSDVRILPPLVNGKLSGVLEFEVDYVEITEKIFKNEDSNFRVQIIWWGETKPLFVRSKKIKFFTKDNKQVIVDEQEGYTVKYEVRTRIQLFKSYLSKCDDVEVSVVDSAKNEVIGSTLLKDLIHLVYNTASFTNSVISDSGDAIGKITCQFRFSEADSEIQVHKTGIEKWNNNNLKINLTELYASKEDFLNLYESSRTNKENKSAKSASIHYNSPVGRVSGLTCVNSQPECLSGLKPTANKVNGDSKDVKPSATEVYREREIKCADTENVTSAERDDGMKNKKTVPPQKARKVEQSRNRNAKQPSRNGVRKTNNVKDSKFPENKPDRTGRGVKKDRGNCPEAVNARNAVTVPKCSKSVVKTISTVKTFEKVSNEISKLNKMYLKADDRCGDSDLENFPVKDEGVTNEKIPSLPEPAVPTEPPEDPEIKNKNESNNSEKIKVNNKLCFDLNDPVEKLYYETFFRKPETLGDIEFEIAELLNQPGNDYIIDGKPGLSERGVKHVVENKSQTENGPSPDDVRLIDSSEDAGCDGRTPGNSEYKMDCHRCKYYKKLSELDKIIDALKNFEAKLRTEVCDDLKMLPVDVLQETDNSDPGVNESDYSKEDSDFIEFRRYLSKR